MWKNINVIIGRNNPTSKTTISSLIKYNNTVVTKKHALFQAFFRSRKITPFIRSRSMFTNHESVAEALNTYFTEIGANLSNSLN